MASSRPTSPTKIDDLDPSLVTAFSNLSIPDSDHELVDSLIRKSKNSPKLIRSSMYQAPAEPAIQIKSWKMNEFKYYDVPSPFPTLARGLFTQDIKTGDGEVKHRIVARGYDKFFNIGEVPWTTWASLEAETTSPYILTLKSNGCIIFIAALTPTKLVVTSKHSLGAIKGQDSESHAQVGERWLRKHLADAGKTEEDLAKVLWEKKWTAVAELCDDSFEEHVLPYSSDQTGLHLHGINACSKDFITMLPPVVDAFAREYGFIVTPSTSLATIPEVKAFTEEIGRTGKWRGQALEGFVVRTHVSSNTEHLPTKPGKGSAASPYKPGSSFFFKVKFDEPYMMYRDWREVTKRLLTQGAKMSNVAKGKLRRPETREYVRWVIGEINRDKSQFKDFAKGKGIIATRERFLKWSQSEEGKKAIAQEESVEQEEKKQEDKKFGKTVIVPVAVPGVGKTTIAVALAHLFGFGHTQSDDVSGKKAAVTFVNNVAKLLQTHDVVIADRNSHLRQHRSALREKFKDYYPPVRLLAMNWSFDLPLSTIHRICGDRITARGENHQTLVADPKRKSHEEVIWMFLQGAEELLEDEVDESIEMDVEESLEDALARAVDACVRILGVRKPSVEEIGEALAVARGYKPSTTKKIDAEGAKETGKKPKPPRYYALLPEVDLEGLLDKYMLNDEVSAAGKDLYRRLLDGKRVAARPHITLVHEKGLPGDQALWDRCQDIVALANPPVFAFKLGDVVWNNRVMALTVTNISVNKDDQDPDAKGVEFVTELPEALKGKLHITVGTRDKDVNPFEARQLVLDWQDGDPAVEGRGLDDVWVKGRVKGLFS
ncbi:RNA ligase-domain-containing protein [Irpex rosettiformis]|uniref:RNA ligase-domain-containing protein n=1 Tax=Irpex rosettiformis TaxID=378272 RepID=A0ACB8U3W3_9APHY|nr:RNA ligase-domain-containing protein [Irpex rosettiformis]